jgi:hypothetical protein
MRVAVVRHDAPPPFWLRLLWVMGLWNGRKAGQR